MPDRAARHGAVGRPGHGIDVRWTRLDSGVLLLLLLEVLLVAGGSVLRRPDLVANETFLLGDQGLNIFLADRIAAGDLLYRDVFSPYGPLPAYLHAAAAGLFGNTINTYNLLLVVLSAVNVGLAYRLVRTRASTGIAAMVVGIGLMPSFLAPGSLLGGFTVSPYIPLERGLLLLTALLWSHPGQRSLSRSASIGIVLGVWQWVKFGGAVFAGAAVILIDLIVLASSTTPGRWRGWVLGASVAAGAFILVEGLGVAVAFLLLPGAVAQDVIWPSYVLEAYSGWVDAEQRWPFAGGPRLLVGQYLTPIVGLGLVAFVAARSSLAAAHRSRSDADAAECWADLRLVLPLAFLLVGLAGYLQQAHIIRQFLWVCVIASAFALKRLSPAARMVCLVLWIPCMAVNFRAMLITQPPAGLATVVLPGGSTIAAPQVVADELMVALQAVDSLRGLHTDAAGEGLAKVLISPMGAGLHALYEIPHAGRQLWLIPGFVRPYDELEILNGSESIAAVLRVGGDTPGSTCPWADEGAFSDSFCSQFAEVIDPPFSVGEMFRIYPAGGGAGPSRRASRGQSGNGMASSRGPDASGGAVIAIQPSQTVREDG